MYAKPTTQNQQRVNDGKEKAIIHDLQQPATNLQDHTSDSLKLAPNTTDDPSSLFEMNNKMVKNPEAVERSTEPSNLEHKNMSEVETDVKLMEDVTLKNGTEIDHIHLLTTHDPHHQPEMILQEQPKIRPEEKIPKPKKKRQSKFYYKLSPEEIEQWREYANVRAKRENKELPEQFFNDLMVEIPVEEWFDSMVLDYWRLL